MTWQRLVVSCLYEPSEVQPILLSLRFAITDASQMLRLPIIYLLIALRNRPTRNTNWLVSTHQSLSHHLIANKFCPSLAASTAEMVSMADILLLSPWWCSWPNQSSIGFHGWMILLLDLDYVHDPILQPCSASMHFHCTTPQNPLSSWKPTGERLQIWRGQEYQELMMMLVSQHCPTNIMRTYSFPLYYILQNPFPC